MTPCQSNAVCEGEEEHEPSVDSPSNSTKGEEQAPQYDARVFPRDIPYGLPALLCCCHFGFQIDLSIPDLVLEGLHLYNRSLHGLRSARINWEEGDVGIMADEESMVNARYGTVAIYPCGLRIRLIYRDNPWS